MSESHEYPLVFIITKQSFKMLRKKFQPIFKGNSHTLIVQSSIIISSNFFLKKLQKY